MNTLSWLIAGPFMYVAAATFIVVTLKKVIAIVGMPRHLRWDLYPIAHEGPAGSVFQKVDHWDSPKQSFLLHELAEMGQEIMLLKRTFLYNRKVWVFTFPMHFGFYLAIGWMALIVAGAAVEQYTGLVISSASTIFWGQLLNAVTVIVGAAGLAMGLFGTAGLLWLRYTDEDLRDYSSPITFFNLYLILALFGVGLASFVLEDPSFTLARHYAGGLITLAPPAGLPPLMLLEIALLGAFLIYLPFSRMLHFAAKYFFYHDIIWDDEPVKAGGNLEKAIGGYLGYKTGWAAPHINPDSTWLEQAVSNPSKPKQEVPRQ